MADLLKVYHLKQAGNPDLPLPKGYWHLATCLRSIVISDQASAPDSLQEHQQMQGHEAYSFLLKIICGLDSPLLGETEVLGQFKTFYKENEKNFSGPLRDILKNLNRDAKKVRSEFLQNLGCTSYGSLLRKQLKDKSVPLTLIGAGSLAQDILPWFAKSESPVRLYTRNPQKYQDLSQQKNLQLMGFQDMAGSSDGGILVVAAPVTAIWVSENFDLSSFDRIYDLRGESQTDPINEGEVVPLHSLFASIEKNKRQAERIKEQAISAIHKHADHLKLIERPRPFGWEDLWTYS